MNRTLSESQPTTIVVLAMAILVLTQIAAAVVFGGKPYKVGRLVGPTTTQPELEEHISVDVSTPANLVAAVIDSSQTGTVSGRQIPITTIKFAFSGDNGITWKEKFLPVQKDGFLETADSRVWLKAVDPVVAIDRKTHNVYLAILYSAPGVALPGVYVGTQKFSNLGDGLTAAKVKRVEVWKPRDNPFVATDKPWIAVDNSSGSCQGNVYTAWQHQEADGSGKTVAISFSQSTDQGGAWSDPKKITGSIKFDDETLQSPQVAVGPAPAGQKAPVYVAYSRIKPGAADPGVKSGEVFIKRSDDCGATFTDPVSVTGKYNDMFGNAFNGAKYRLNSFPALAVSPKNGKVALLWAPCTVAGSQNCDGGKGMDVLFTISNDKGATWSPPAAFTQVTDGQQFFPALTAAPNGGFHAVWLDTSASKDLLKPDVFAAFTLDDGTTMSPAASVASMAIKAEYTVIGDYIGIAAAGGFAHPVWNTGGVDKDDKGISSLQTATLTLP